MHSKERQDGDDHNDQANEIDQSVHGSLPKLQVMTRFKRSRTPDCFLLRRTTEAVAGNMMRGECARGARYLLRQVKRDEECEPKTKVMKSRFSCVIPADATAESGDPSNSLKRHIVAGTGNSRVGGSISPLGTMKFFQFLNCGFPFFALGSY